MFVGYWGRIRESKRRRGLGVRGVEVRLCKVIKSDLDVFYLSIVYSLL